MNDIVKIKSPSLPTAGPPLAGLLAAARTYEQIDRCRYGMRHDPNHAAFATKVRNEHLPLRLLLPVEAAHDEVSRALYRDDNWQGGIASLAMLYRSLGAKPADVDNLVKGALTALLNDDMGKIGGWEPVRATPSIVAIAVRKLLQKAIYKPMPAELVKACKEVRGRLVVARMTFNDWINDLQKADAVLLHFAHDEWEQPYRLPQYRPALELLLMLHEGAEVGKVYANEFEKLVEQEQFKIFGQEETS